MNRTKSTNGRTVVLKENENISQALRRFKRKVEESNVLEDLRKKEFFEKPTSKRKRSKSAAIARWKKKLKENELPAKLY